MFLTLVTPFWLETIFADPQSFSKQDGGKKMTSWSCELIGARPRRSSVETTGLQQFFLMGWVGDRNDMKNNFIV